MRPCKERPTGSDYPEDSFFHSVGLYFVVPVDFVPDLIAGIGWIDDLIISICGLGGLVLNICWALGVRPAPGNNDDGYEDDYNYDGEYGYYREV